MPNFNGTNGNDTYTGGSTNDTIIGNGGDDNLVGSGGNDLIAGGLGNDLVEGGDGDDFLASANVQGNFGAYATILPSLDRGSERDTLSGGDGWDRLYAGYGDNADGGTGIDYLSISFLGATSGVTADFSLPSLSIGGGTIQNIENLSYVEGSNFDDFITIYDRSGGYADFTQVYGLAGNDTLIASYYTWSLYGGDGNDVVDGRLSQYLDRVDGGAGDDTLYTNSNTFAAAYGGAGNDAIYSHGETYGGDGNDKIFLSFTYYPGLVSGDAGDDFIDAGETARAIAGGSGADIINGSNGSDDLGSADILEYRYRYYDSGSIFADDMGLEHDVIAGFGGKDRISIGYGDDADGGSDTDTLRLSLAGASSGVVFNSAGIASGGPFSFAGGTIQNFEIFEYLSGSAFSDTLTIATQSSLLVIDAGAGDDVITSNGSSVELFGGDGNDLFISGAAGDVFNGGAGNDTISFVNSASGGTFSLSAVGSGNGPGGDQFSNVENVLGSQSGDTINGNDLSNVLSGNGGNDVLNAGAGNDILSGGEGDDVMDGGAGVDTVDYWSATQRVIVALADSGTNATGQGIDTLIGIEIVEGSKFDDRLFGDAGNNRFLGRGGDDTIYGRGGADVLFGAAGNDYLDGGADNDRMEGNDGNDILIGGAGDDILDGGAGSDTVDYWGVATRVIVDLAGSGANAQGDGSDTLIGIENVEGTSLDDRLLGDGANNYFLGRAGDDVIQGRAGADLLFGGAGNDTLDGGADNDRLEGAGGNDILIGGTGNDILDGGDGTDTVDYWTATSGLTINLSQSGTNASGEGSDTLISIENVEGSRFNDMLTGNDGHNVLLGRGGDDIIFGQNGADTLFGAGGDDQLDGGRGPDRLEGGTGNDVFLYRSTADSNRVAWDWISDFSLGDKIDLSAIDASTHSAGDQAFTFIGSNAFSGVWGGEVRAYQSGSKWIVECDDNGDALADVLIHVTTDHILTASDFFL